MTTTSALGYALSSEEHPPLDLVRHARMAEEAGFSFGLISDHFHPWIGRQGNSPFVWGVLGAIAAATRTMRFGTGVTCPTTRIHPAIIAHAAATAAELMPDRFFLGVGTGENLNEHVLGQRWPEWDVRAAMLEEAIEVIRELWKGDIVSHYGEFYSVENARLYTVPRRRRTSTWPAAASEPQRWRGGSATGSSGPGPGGAHRIVRAGWRQRAPLRDGDVCWGRTEATAREIAHEWWPTVAIPASRPRSSRTPPTSSSWPRS